MSQEKVITFMALTIANDSYSCSNVRSWLRVSLSQSISVFASQRSFQCSCQYVRAHGSFPAVLLIAQVSTPTAQLASRVYYNAAFGAHHTGKLTLTRFFVTHYAGADRDVFRMLG